jgi:ribosomal protein L11 methyltransferase
MIVDWHQQWELFAENFYEGKAHIDLSQFGGDSTLLLLPGPGFGDLSHPTTYLMLQLMQTKVKGQRILDIGCGSGILSLAALKLGAASAVGIDIDPDAIEHAKANAALNGLKAHFGLALAPNMRSNQIALMNMILPEQKAVMAQKHGFSLLAKYWITSGILAIQRDEYYALAKEWGWTLEQEVTRGEWLGMVFRGLTH